MSSDMMTVNNLLLLLISGLGAFLAALWLSMVIWTFRDMRSRSRDMFATLLATLVVALLNLPGLLVYLILRPQETLIEAYERSLEEEALLQEIEEKPMCPGCGRSVRENWQVCPTCHTKLKKTCGKCGYVLELPWKICPVCATPQIRREPRTVPVQDDDDLGGLEPRVLRGSRRRRESPPRPRPQPEAPPASEQPASKTPPPSEEAAEGIRFIDSEEF